MGVALHQTRTGDLNKLGIGAQLRNAVAAHIAHTGAQTAHHLEHGIAYRALVRYTTLYALRHELLGAVLEVTVGRTLVHGA